jgi:hypothetical protein
MNRLRLGLALAGLGVAALAVAADSRVGGWVGIALLASSLVIRLIQHRRDRV